MTELVVIPMPELVVIPSLDDKAVGGSNLVGSPVAGSTQDLDGRDNFGDLGDLVEIDDLAEIGDLAGDLAGLGDFAGPGGLGEIGDLVGDLVDDLAGDLAGDLVGPGLAC